jgi:hypothetical protein
MFPEGASSLTCSCGASACLLGLTGAQSAHSSCGSCPVCRCSANSSSAESENAYHLVERCQIHLPNHCSNWYSESDVRCCDHEVREPAAAGLMIEQREMRGRSVIPVAASILPRAGTDGGDGTEMRHCRRSAAPFGTLDIRIRHGPMSNVSGDSHALSVVSRF